MSNDALNLVMKQWEDSRILLSAALRQYLDSWTSLETILGLGCGHPNAKNNASHIESTLSSLQYDMTQQLAQFNSTLARARNRLTSSIWCLPKEVLFEIFLHVVYAPEHKNMPMERCVQMMYSSLHDLVTVCSDWRNFILNQGVFWETIPACDLRIKYQAIDLSIQRAGNRGLRLATILPETGTPPGLIKIVEDNASRFCALNVQFENADDVHNLVRQLSRNDAQLSELSIHCTHTIYLSEDPEDFPIFPDHPFARLGQSLSILRLYGCLGNWANITFSDRLVELFIHTVKLFDSGSAMASFLSAISSANELRDLTIIDLQACHNSAETASLLARPKIVFPKLRTLVLQDLWFNVLELVLLVLAPGSYHVTLELKGKVLAFVHIYDFLSYDRIKPDNLARLLSRVNIDRLEILCRPVGYNWLSGTDVRKLLAAVPRLKELYMDSWKFDFDFCNKLFTTSTSEDEHGELAFHSLECLEVTHIYVVDEEGFKRCLANIPSQKVIFGGEFSINGSDRYMYRRQFQGDEDLVGWLKCNMPGFCLVGPEHSPTYRRASEWRLW